MKLWRDLRPVLTPFLAAEPRQLALGAVLAALTVLMGMALLHLTGARRGLVPRLAHPTTLHCARDTPEVVDAGAQSYSTTRDEQAPPTARWCMPALGAIP